MQFGLSTLLVLIFLVLKLCNVIAWSWWLVFTPLYVSVVIWLLLAWFAFRIVRKHF